MKPYLRRLTILWEPGQEPSVDHEGMHLWEAESVLTEVLDQIQIQREREKVEREIVEEAWEEAAAHVDDEDA